MRTKRVTNMSKPIQSNILKCPECGNTELIKKDNVLTCSSCKKSYVHNDGKFHFFHLDSEDVEDSVDKIKYFIKKFKVLYDILKKVIGPVLPTDESRLNRIIKKFHDKNPDAVIINLGSGNTDLSPHISNVDIFSYDNVDLTCDISNLPLQENTVDLIVNIAVLEHVPNPEKVVSEIHRVLKKDGTIYCFFPFMQPFHASPYDFSRRSQEGLKYLFQDFSIETIKPSGGPTSGFLWIFQEWLAITLSFGLPSVQKILAIVFMALTWPLKLLDYILIKHPMAKNISSGFLLIAKK